MRRMPSGPVVLTAGNLLLVIGALLAIQKWPARPSASSPQPNAVADSPVAALSTPPVGGRGSSCTYYLVGTQPQADLLQKMDPHGTTIVITSPSDEAKADALIYDDSQQRNALRLPPLQVLDLRLDSAPQALSGKQTIESQVAAKLPGVQLDPAYADAVTYYVVDSPTTAALLNATLQRLARAGVPAPAPVSRYAISIDPTPRDPAGLGRQLEEAMTGPGAIGPVAFRLVDLRPAASVATPVESGRRP